MLQQSFHVFISVSSRFLTAQLFPGQLTINRTFEEDMENKNSALFKDTAKNITDAVGDHMEDLVVHFEKVDFRSS